MALPDISPDLHLIRSYGPDGFQVHSQLWPGSIVIYPGGVRAWELKNIQGLTLAGIQELVEGISPLEVLLLGTGPQFVRLQPALKEQIRRLPFSVDEMDSGAACRTYNLLAREGRAVAAALLMDERFLPSQE